MILNGNEDLRVRKTITGIQQAFIDEILRTNYSKITVKSICDKAMINKKTFYNYYQSLDDLLYEMQEVMLSEFLERTEKYNVPEDLYKINEEFFRYSVDKGEVYEKIMCCESYSFVGKDITRKFVKSVWNNFSNNKLDNEYKKNILFAYLHNLGLELYRQWVFDEKKIALNEIIEISGKLLCSGVNGLLNIKD